jgi:hypothetical protein
MTPLNPEPPPGASHRDQVARPRTPPSWGGPLCEGDYASLAASWITQQIADHAMLRRVDAHEGREIVGQNGNRDCTGVLIPYYWPDEPSPFNYRLRRDNPEWVVGKDGKPKPKGKYLGPPKCSNRLYIPPGITPEQLRDATIPLVIAEGEKKGLALWRLACHEIEAPRFIPIAIPGVWSWRGTVGKSQGPQGERIEVKGPIADLSRIEWKGRRVFVVFDANVRSNASVAAARRGIARELSNRGADLQFINLPEDCGVNGVDDLLALWGPERVLNLFAQAEPAPAEETELTQAQVLIALAGEALLFHTAESEAYARVPVDEHHETWMLRSKGFRRWLMRKFFQSCGKPPRVQALQDAISLLEAKAQFEAPEAPLFVRIAEYSDRIYIDLSNAKWQAVEITQQGWRVIADPPVHFRRAKGMQALPQPQPGGSIKLLRKLINVGADDNWSLCAAWLVAACRPKGPYPILILQGEQGSAKSTMVKFLRRVLDPSIALVRTPPREERDLLIAAANSRVIAYDNVSGVPPWLSDSLCRLATGGGFSTRELYTDSEEVFFDAMRPVVLNGIDHLAERADLADRALILHLPHIDNRYRKDEAQLYSDFERDLSQILGALFTAVSGALARLPHIKLESKPRMADFALWATAAELALGFSNGDFMRAYLGNRAEVIQETLEADPVGAAIVALMDALRDAERPGSWDGTCKELLPHLEQLVGDAVKMSRSWPKTPRGLSSRLRRLVTFLLESGIHIVFHPKGTKGQRPITIEGTARHSTATTAATATPDRISSLDQPVAVEPLGGGRVVGVAVESPPYIGPPPGPAAANSLNGRGNQPRVAEVAEVAVVCGEIPHAQASSEETHDRVDLCTNCGRADWEWVGGAWVCPGCGEPAHGQRTGDRRQDVERFEL